MTGDTTTKRELHRRRTMAAAMARFIGASWPFAFRYVERPRCHGWFARAMRRQSAWSEWWPGAESNCRPQVFQTCALPTELPGRCSVAGTTGFEPAISGLTGRRELQASPRPRGPEAVHLGHPQRLRGLGEYRAGGPRPHRGIRRTTFPIWLPLSSRVSASASPSKGRTMSIGTVTRRDPTISVTSAKSAWSNMVDPMISSCL